MTGALCASTVTLYCSSMMLSVVFPASKSPAFKSALTTRQSCALSDSPRLRLQLRIWVTDFRGVRSSRTGIEFAQQTVISGLCFQFRNLAVGIIDVAENDGARRA